MRGVWGLFPEIRKLTTSQRSPKWIIKITTIFGFRDSTKNVRMRRQTPVLNFDLALTWLRARSQYKYITAAEDQLRQTPEQGLESRAGVCHLIRDSTNVRMRRQTPVLNFDLALIWLRARSQYKYFPAAKDQLRQTPELGLESRAGVWRLIRDSTNVRMRRQTPVLNIDLALTWLKARSQYKYFAAAKDQLRQTPELGLESKAGVWRLIRDSTGASMNISLQPKINSDKYQNWD